MVNPIIIIRVHSRPFVVSPTSASICVHLRLVFLFLGVLNRESTRMTTEISPHRHGGHRALLFPEGGNGLPAWPDSEVNSIFIRVNSRAFAVRLLSASICVHLRLAFLFLEV